jgi:hypothetical protein
MNMSLVNLLSYSSSEFFNGISSTGGDNEGEWVRERGNLSITVQVGLTPTKQDDPP